MPDARQLARLTELACERRDRAAKKLGRSIALLRDSESRVELLQRYRDDYGTRLARSAAGGLSADELRNFREFIARLEEGIAQQRSEVLALRRSVEECRTGWLAERRRQHSFELLSERADLGARELEARRLPKLVDEFAGRMPSMYAVG